VLMIVNIRFYTVDIRDHVFVYGSDKIGFFIFGG